MHEAAVSEFPFVADMPKREKSRLARLWDTFQQIREATNRHGCLLPQHYAADLLGVSRQRVHVLVNEGRLTSVEVAGVRYVTEDSLLAWATSERDKGGRPPSVPSVRECFSKALKYVREEASHPTKKS